MKIQPKCPTCDRLLRPVEASTAATTVHDRTCQNRRCHRKWRVVARPLGGKIAGAFIHLVNLHPMVQVASDGSEKLFYTVPVASQTSM